MANFNEALKKKKAEEEKKKKDKGVVIPLVQQEEKKGKMDLFAFAKNPMIQMAAKSMPPKVKIIIALAVVMLLVGVGATVYGIYLLLNMIPFVHNMPMTGSNIFYGFGFLYIIHAIWDLIYIKNGLKEDENELKVFNSTIDMIKNNVDKGNINEIKKAPLTMLKNIHSTNGVLIKMLRYAISVWMILGFFSSQARFFITLFLANLCSAIFKLVSKKNNERLIIAITSSIVKIGIASYILYNHFIILS